MFFESPEIVVHCTVSDLFSGFQHLSICLLKRRLALLHASILKNDKNCVGGLTGIQPVPRLREFCDKRCYKVPLLFFLVHVTSSTDTSERSFSEMKRLSISKEHSITISSPPPPPPPPLPPPALIAQKGLGTGLVILE